MDCGVCRKRKASITKASFGVKLCNNCFAKLIEKKIRKTIRIKDLIKKGDNILLVDDSSIKSAILKHFFKEPLFNKIIKLKIIKKEMENKRTIIPWNLDDEAEAFLKWLLYNKRIKQDKNLIKPLIHLTEEECELYAKIKKLNYKKQKPTELKKLLNQLEAKHPSIKYSLLKSIKNSSIH